MYVICVFVCACSLIFFVCHCVCLCIICFFPSNVNSIVYTLMYVHIFGYLVSKLEIWWVYLSPIEKKYKKLLFIFLWLHRIAICCRQLKMCIKSICY